MCYRYSYWNIKRYLTAENFNVLFVQIDDYLFQDTEARQNIVNEIRINNSVDENIIIILISESDNINYPVNYYGLDNLCKFLRDKKFKPLNTLIPRKLTITDFNCSINFPDLSIIPNTLIHI